MLLKALLISCFAMQAYAVETAQVLPIGVRHPAIRQGFISNVGERFDNGGDLISIEDRYSKNFDANQIAQYVPKVKDLVKLLDQQFPQQYQLGSNLNVGTLSVKADPKVAYTAASFAYGVTSNWTIGFGVPVIHYTADVNVQQTGVNNSSQIAAAISQNHVLSSDLDRAFHQLERIDLVSELNNTLASKGYKPLSNRDQTFVGDLQLVSLYQYYHDTNWTLAEKTTLILPTGPKQDPDDLLSLPGNGQTAIQLGAISDFAVNSKMILGAALSYKFVLPDTVVKRVPRDNNDLFPDADRKEEIYRDLGDTVELEMNTRWKVTSVWQTAFAWVLGSKGEDYYNGNRRYNYYLLSQNSEASWQKIQAELSYTTVDLFMAKNASVPLVATYLYSDYLIGKNIERQQLHEVALKLFF